MELRIVLGIALILVSAIVAPSVVLDAIAHIRLDQPER